MSSPFNSQGEVPTPVWVENNGPSTTFTPLSSTGFIQLLGGYGLGTYGGGGYGEGDATISVVSNSTDIETIWTEYTDK